MTYNGLADEEKSICLTVAEDKADIRGRLVLGDLFGRYNPWAVR